MYKVGLMNSSTNAARTPLKIGILGAARIAPSAIVAPAHATGHRLVAVASRDIKKAEEFAKQHQVEGVYGNYQDLIDDPEIDVIYNALHDGAHGPWNIRAMQAGKHVLVKNHLHQMLPRRMRWPKELQRLEKFLWRVFITTTIQFSNASLR
jgi:shikimate 5-dehydrogenase